MLKSPPEVQTPQMPAWPAPSTVGHWGIAALRDTAYRHAATPFDENSPNKHWSKRNVSSAARRLICSFFQHRPWITSRSELSQVRLYGPFLYILTRVNTYTHSAQYTRLPKLRNLCKVFPREQMNCPKPLTEVTSLPISFHLQHLWWSLWWGSPHILARDGPSFNPINVQIFNDPPKIPRKGMKQCKHRHRNGEKITVLVKSCPLVTTKSTVVGFFHTKLLLYYQ